MYLAVLEARPGLSDLNVVPVSSVVFRLKLIKFHIVRHLGFIVFGRRPSTYVFSCT